MVPAYTKVHNRFKYNGIHYNQEDLKEVAYSLIKEGERYEKEIGNFLLDWLDEKDYLYIKTSGSTGTFKHIKTSKQAMVNSAIKTGDFFNLEPGDRALHCLPTGFVAGKMMLIRAFVLGLEIDVIAPSKQPVFDTNKHYDFSGMVPMQLGLTYGYINNIKNLIVGGARVSSELKECIKEVPSKIYETFGMTETITHIALKPINNAANIKNCFTVLEDVNISKDERGCLVINAPHIADKAIITNDLVALQTHNEFEWLGRFDNVINSGGIKFSPEQIEGQLSEYISNRFFITSQPDNELGEKIVLVIESESIDINKNIFNKLDNYATPKQVLAVPKFIETETGKINRTETLKSVLELN